MLASSRNRLSSTIFFVFIVTVISNKKVFIKKPNELADSLRFNG